jgi:hypothetical protein
LVHSNNNKSEVRIDHEGEVHRLRENEGMLKRTLDDLMRKVTKLEGGNRELVLVWEKEIN